MSSSSEPEGCERERRLEEILAAFLAAEDQGRPVDLESILIQHPDLASVIRAFLGEHLRIGSLAAPLRAMACAASYTDETTALDTQSIPAAPRRPATRPPYETTEVQGAPLALTPQAAEDPYATAPVTNDGLPEPDFLDSGTRVRYFGDYVLLNVIGQGGMGVVYKARQISLNRPVALKMLQAGMLAMENDLRRFQNEAEAVAMLDHPHIVPILEVGQYEERRYFSMKLIGGPSLDRKVGAFTNDAKAAARLVMTVAQAVHHAHQRGILHRDLKPGNVILDDRGLPHVTDFGLAKRVQADSELTQTGAILGTPAYMAPEQASGKRGMVTTATDVYGLGAILYALLTGRAPLGGESPVEILENVRDRIPESPSKINPCVPRDLAIITLKCLEKDPARRYSSAEALADDLRRHLNGESILARPVWLATRAWMWCKRNPAMTRMAMAMLFTLLVTALSGLGLVIVDQARRREAEVRMEAETNFNMAQVAVEDYLTSVSENTLLMQQDSADFRSLRRELLNNALSYYKNFVNQRGDDPRLRRQLASAYYRVGRITRETGAVSDAIAAFRSAQALWEPLAAAEPNDHVLRGRLAECHLAIGKLQSSTGDLQAAVTSLKQGLELLESLAQAHPDVPSYTASLAGCYMQIGIIQNDLKLPDHARGALERAKTIQEHLIARIPGRDADKQMLAEIALHMGNHFYEWRDYPAALLSFEEGQRISRSLLVSITDGHKRIPVLELLAISHYNVALIQMQIGQSEKGLRSIEQSLEIRSSLKDSYASVSHYQEQFGKSAEELALLQHEAHQDDKALASIKRSIDILEKLVRLQPDQPGYRHDLGRNWNILG